MIRFVRCLGIGNTMTGIAILICFLSLACVVQETLSSGNCENTILENLEDVINISSSNTPYKLAKEVLKNFFLHVNGHNRFIATKERKCKENQLSFDQFLDRTSLHFSGHSVCGNSFFRISVATIVTFLHLERFICSENKEPYLAYVEQIPRINLLHAVSRHIHHDRNKTDLRDTQCLNEIRLKKMVEIILGNSPHFNHQHNRRQTAPKPATDNVMLDLKSNSSVNITTGNYVQEKEASTLANFEIANTTDITKTPVLASIISHYNGSETHCFIKEDNNKIVCIGLNSKFRFATFYCLKTNSSDLYKCARYRGKSNNNTFILILMSSFNAENTDNFQIIAEKMAFVPPVGYLAWQVKYISYRPLKLILDKQSEADSSKPSTLNPFQEIPSKEISESNKETLETVRKHGYPRKGFNHDNRYHVTDQEARSALIVFAVIKQHFLQPRNLPCPDEVLKKLYAYCIPPTSQYLTVNDIQKKFKKIQNNPIGSVGHKHHNERKRSLSENRDSLYSKEKSRRPLINSNTHDHLFDNVLRHEFKEGHSRHHSSSYNHNHSYYNNHDHSSSDNHEHSSSDNHEHSSSDNHEHSSSDNHEHSSSDNHDHSPENSHAHYSSHNHDHPSEYDHDHSSENKHDHSHSQQIHGHTNECPRLFSSLHSDQGEHFGGIKHEENWTIDDIPYIYFGSRTTLSLQDLRDIAPGLLWLMLKDDVRNSGEHAAVTHVQSYGLGTLCIVFLSLASVLGAIFIKITGTKKKAYLLSFMLALSVGCLLGDAVLHLVPSTLGQHNHDNLGKLVILLATMYGFFLIQLIVGLFHKDHDHSKMFTKDSNKSTVDLTKNEALELENKARKSVMVLNNKSKEDAPMERQESNESQTYVTMGRQESNKSHRDFSMERQESNESQKDLTIEECPSESNVSTVEREIFPVVWMVIIGDCVHNFADGLAIGATFTQSLTEGLSTALAVLCHEIPHELGDFAILLAAGFTVKRAIVVNLLSSITAFIGLYIGISVGEEFRIWIIAAGAGMFLYISMVTMIPELVKIFKTNTCKEMFLSLNLGYILGVVAMLFLAIYEENLKLT